MRGATLDGGYYEEIIGYTTWLLLLLLFVRVTHCLLLLLFVRITLTVYVELCVGDDGVLRVFVWVSRVSCCFGERRKKNESIHISSICGCLLSGYLRHSK